MLTEETLDRLEAHAQAQHGKPIATGVIVTPGQLLELLRGYRAQISEAAPPATEIETAS